MVHTQDSEELTMSANKTSSDSSTTKFFSIYALLGIGFGCAIALFDLMFNPILSALLGLIFIFVGSACAMVAAAKFLHAMDQRINKP